MQKRRKNIRLENYDYKTNGYYFVTIVTKKREKYFEQNYRSVVARFIAQLDNLSGVSVDYSIIMSDHVHLILILEECDMTLGEVVRKFKSLCSHATGISLWQPNYYEHVIQNEKSLTAIRRYVENNPLAEKIKWEEVYGETIPAINK